VIILQTNIVNNLDIEVLDRFIKVIPSLNNSQIKAITATEGPLQIIAGPGSGKSLVLVLRTLYLLLTNRAKPNEILITTFTEKASFELRNSLSYFADILNYEGHLDNIHLGTIHSICDNLLQDKINNTEFKPGYKVLDELEQILFIRDKLDIIVPHVAMEQGSKYLSKWTTKWEMAKGLIPYFNKITEELIDISKLLYSKESFHRVLARAFINYEKVLVDSQRIDFPHLQKAFYELLIKKRNQKLTIERIKDIKYLMIDEYQDTNYIQEKIFFEMAFPYDNICIVGDEDQSLYRFRGATIRNILEFHSNFPNCQKIVLNINYRSHNKIVEFYNRFMRSIDWSDNIGNKSFRFNKNIVSSVSKEKPYSSVVTISKKNIKEEAEDFADFIVYLKENNIIDNYSQVALLLHSVRLDKSGPYIEALKNRQIPYYNPRSKGFFDRKEIMEMIGCLAFLFDSGIESDIEGIDTTGETNPRKNKIGFCKYLRLCRDSVNQFENNNDLIQFFKVGMHSDKSEEKQILDNGIADYFYKLLAFRPFCNYMTDENKSKNLSLFLHLLLLFQEYYHIDRVNQVNKKDVSEKLFYDFFDFLSSNGINDNEEKNDPIPAGFVQIMTMHQSKGLEFPVVIVGSLNLEASANRQIDKDLSSFYNKPFLEPMNKIPTFDLIRQFYVSFTRAEKILVLTYNHSSNVNKVIKPFLAQLPSWRQISVEDFCDLPFKSKPLTKIKSCLGYTSDIRLYETCPRQYLFYRKLGFHQTKSEKLTFGDLIHQTIDDIHYAELNGKLGHLTNEIIIEDLFINNYQNLINHGKKPLSENEKLLALDAVLNYFNQKFGYDLEIINSEFDIYLETPLYIIKGRIDLLTKSNNEIELVDFKTHERTNDEGSLIDRYYNQLCTYALVLKEGYDIHPDKLAIYWTSMVERDHALTPFKVSDVDLEKSKKFFDSIATSILQRDFSIKNKPDEHICKGCDFKYYCSSQGTISYDSLYKTLFAY